MHPNISASQVHRVGASCMKGGGEVKGTEGILLFFDERVTIDRWILKEREGGRKEGREGWLCGKKERKKEIQKTGVKKKIEASGLSWCDRRVPEGKVEFEAVYVGRSGALGFSLRLRWVERN